MMDRRSLTSALRAVVPLSLKVAGAKLIANSYTGQLVGFFYQDQIPCRGLSVATSAAVNPVTKAQLLFGMYESAEVRLVNKYLRADLDVIELGSSIGVVSAHIAQGLAHGRHMVCLEANPALLALVEANVRQNAPTVRFTVLHGAFDYSAVGETIQFIIGKESILSRIGVPGPNDRSVDVPRVTLEDILERHDFVRYALVCDIEGSESGLLETDVDILRRCDQAIMELHPCVIEGRRVTPAEFVTRFCDLAGLTVTARDGAAVVLER